MTDRIIQKSFEYFFRKTYSQDRFQFHYSPHTLKIYETLVKELDKKVQSIALSKIFTWRYCIFQFAYWQDVRINTPSSKIGFSHIFGKKAVDRYFARNREYDWQLEEHYIITKYNLSLIEFTKHLGDGQEERECSDNPIRKKFLNTDKGLVTCISQTTLFDRKDSSCLICNFQNECKEILKTNYPKIYQSRYGR